MNTRIEPPLHTASSNQSPQLHRIVTKMTSHRTNRQHNKLRRQSSVLIYHDKNLGSVKIYHNQVLGAGSFGEVCKAEQGKEWCVAKRLYESTFKDQAVLKRLEEECQELSKIEHPNLTRYLGASREPPAQRLVLLMEAMDTDLTRFLERSTGPLPYDTQLSICSDVARALSHLHSIGIIHKNLSSNNVLLSSDASTAKLADFGMSLLTDHLDLDSLEECTRVQMEGDRTKVKVYMPPEALTEDPHYTSKLDCFSFGVLIIQIITRLFPSPTEACKPHTHERVPEIERRKQHIDLIESDHLLLPIALHCIQDRPEGRPSADGVCERLSQYIAAAKKVAFTKKLNETLSIDDEVFERPKPTEVLETPASSEKPLASLAEEAKGTPPLDSEMSEQLPLVEEECDSAPIQISEWQEMEPAPADFTSIAGDVAIHEKTVYISTGNYAIYSLTLPDSKWTKLPRVNYRQFAIAIVNNQLTTIGGRDYDFTTDALFSLTQDSKRWEKIYPPMPTTRAHPAAIATGNHLVVAGGHNGFYSGTDAVEVLDIDTRQWFIAKSLPEKVIIPQMVLCEGQLYLGYNASVFSCSMDELLASCTPTPTHSASVWPMLPIIPAYHASLVAVGGRVLAVGGTRDGNRTGAIHCYHTAKNSWSVIGELPMPLSNVLATPLTTPLSLHNSESGESQRNDNHIELTVVGGNSLME